MSNDEKGVLALRLKAELAEFKDREQTYNEKRKEL